MRFRLTTEPLPKYRASRQVGKLLWYLDHPWTEANVRWLRRRLDAWSRRAETSPYTRYAIELEEYPDLYDRLYGMLRDWERVEEYYAAVARRARETELADSYERITSSLSVIRGRIEERAQRKYPKSAAWRARYIRESLEGDEEYSRLSAEFTALPREAEWAARERRKSKSA